MAFSCLRKDSFTKEFTVLLVHVIHVSHPSALVGSAAYARELVDRFFTKYTQLDLREFERHNHKFRNLIASSRLEIAFEGKPKGYKVPNYKIYKYEHSKGFEVLFELEVRLIKRYIPPNTEYDHLEVERTDYLPLVGCVQRHMEDMRISFTDPQ
jgi:hypothetical protein